MSHSNADELIGLLGTFSWIITMPEETREGVIAEARRLLRELLGVEGEVTVDVAFRADAWRAADTTALNPDLFALRSRRSRAGGAEGRS